MIVAGIVRKTKTGFKNVFSNAKTIATNKEVVKFSTAIPGKKWANRKTITVEISSLMIRFIIINFILKIKKRHQKRCLLYNIFLFSY